MSLEIKITSPEPDYQALYEAEREKNIKLTGVLSRMVFSVDRLTGAFKPFMKKVAETLGDDIAEGGGFSFKSMLKKPGRILKLLPKLGDFEEDAGKLFEVSQAEIQTYLGPIMETYLPYMQALQESQSPTNEDKQLPAAENTESDERQEDS